MTYTPMNIMSFDVEEQEKRLKPNLVSSNLGLISQETKELGDNIMRLETRIAQLIQATGEEKQSFAKLFIGTAGIGS